MKKALFSIILIGVMIFNACDVLCAELDGYDFHDVDEMLEDYEISFLDIAKLVVKGDFKGAAELAGDALKNGLMRDFYVHKETIIRILIIGIIGAVFKNISTGFMSGQAGRMGEYIVQIALVSIVSGATLMAADLARTVIEDIIGFMEALIPTYAIVVTGACGSAGALAFYELIMFIILMVEKVMLKIALPGVNVYMMIVMMNYLSGNSNFGKFGELIRELLGWVNKSLLGIVIGLNFIKGMIAPMLDSLKGTAVNKVLSMIPGVGNAVDTAASVLIGSGTLIKNAVGVTAMIFIFVICAFPVVKLFIFAYGLKAAGAILEPVADKGYCECVNSMFYGIKLIMSMVLTVVILFVLTIAMICAVFSASV